MSEDSMNDNEDRFESIEMILKQRSDGVSWFDYLFDFIAKDCEGGGGDCIVDDSDESDCDDHEHTEILPCTCGLESFGGRSGTLEQCYDHQLNVAADISPIMLARALIALADEQGDYKNVRKCLDWANKEIEFEEYFEKRGGDNGEEG